MRLFVFSLLAFTSLVACNTNNNKAAVNPQVNENSQTTEKLDTLKFPKANNWVNDFEKELTTDQQKELDLICKDYETATTNQLMVATIADYKPYEDIAAYSKDLFNEWGIGQKPLDNGVLIVVCMKCQEVRIETGLGAERILTNEICDRIIDPGMIDYFEKKDVYGGIKYGIKEVIKRWNN